MSWWKTLLKLVGQKALEIAADEVAQKVEAKKPRRSSRPLH